MALRRLLGTTATTGNPITNAGFGGQAIFQNAPTGTATMTWNADIPPGVSGKSVRLYCPSATDTATFYFSANSAAPLAGSFYMKILAFGGAAMNIAAFRTSGQNGGVNLDASRRLTITNAGGTPLKSFATAVPMNTWVRVDPWEDPATTSTGSVFFGYYLGHDPLGSEVEAPLNAVGTANVGASDTTEFRIAKTTATGTCEILFWGYADNSGATGPIGPALVSGDSSTAVTSTLASDAALSVSSGSTSAVTATLAAAAVLFAVAGGATAITAAVTSDAVVTRAAVTDSTDVTATVTSTAGKTLVAPIDSTTVTATTTAAASVSHPYTAATDTTAVTATLATGATTAHGDLIATDTQVTATVTASAHLATSSGSTTAVTAGVTAAATRATTGQSSTPVTASFDAAASRGVYVDGFAVFTVTLDADAAIARIADNTLDVTATATTVATVTHHSEPRDITVTARLVPTTYRAGLIPTAYTARIGDTVIVGSTIYQHVALTADHDISADTVRISLNGGVDWFDLDHVAGTTDSTWRILLGDGQALDPTGDATALVQINDDPEVVIVNAGRFYVTTA